ncbi:MAG: DUF5320 domain-containing protein [Verrucomicrobiota bacterium]
MNKVILSSSYLLVAIAASAITYTFLESEGDTLDHNLESGSSSVSNRASDNAHNWLKEKEVLEEQIIKLKKELEIEKQLAESFDIDEGEVLVNYGTVKDIGRSYALASIRRNEIREEIMALVGDNGWRDLDDDIRQQIRKKIMGYQEEFSDLAGISNQLNDWQNSPGDATEFQASYYAEYLGLNEVRALELQTLLGSSYQKVANQGLVFDDEASDEAIEVIESNTRERLFSMLTPEEGEKLSSIIGDDTGVLELQNTSMFGRSWLRGLMRWRSSSNRE